MAKSNQIVNPNPQEKASDSGLPSWSTEVAPDVPAEAVSFYNAAGDAYKAGVKDGKAKKDPAYTHPSGDWSADDLHAFDQMYTFAWQANHWLTDETRVADFRIATRDALVKGIKDGEAGADKWHEPTKEWWTEYKNDLDQTYELGYAKGQSLAPAKSASTSPWVYIGVATAIAAVCGIGFALSGSGAAVPAQANPTKFPGLASGDPKPKFRIGDRVRQVDTGNTGKVSFIGEYDALIGGYRYKVQVNDAEHPRQGGRWYWNETNMRKI
jgi:hypothetical protein